MKLILKAAVGIFILANTPSIAQTKKIQPHPTKTANTTVKKELSSDELFLKRNSSIKTFSREPGYVLVIQKKDGTTERFSMDIFNDEKKFLNAYGKPPLYKSVKEPTPAGVSN